jgi:HEAT repeat protein
MVPGMSAGPNELEPAFEKLKVLSWEDGRHELRPIIKALQSNPAEIEPRMGALLASNVPPPAKDFICRELSVYGTSVSVPFLAPLLLDKELSHLSRFALERIGGAQASTALRNALPSAPANLKLGIINSLGNMRDQKAAPLLAALLKEGASARAARLALAKIGGPEATRALGDSANPSGVEARLIIAENIAKAGDKDRACSMFQRIFAQSEGASQAYGAFHGMLDTASAAEKEKLILNALAGSDERLREIATEWLSNPHESSTLRKAIEKFPTLPSKGQLAVLEALRNSEDVSGRSTARKALNSKDSEVRLAAIKTLGIIGESSDLRALLDIATSTKPEDEQAAAEWALANLPGKKVDEQLTQLLRSGRDAHQEIVLLRTLAARHSPGANEVIQSRLRTPGQSRLAALQALAVLGDPRQIPTLVPLLADADAQSAQQVEKTIESIVERAAGQALEPLNQAYQDASPVSRKVIVRQYGIIAGPRALQAVRAAMKDSDSQVREEAFRVLADWPGVGAAPDLLALAKEAEMPGWKPLALRNFIRLCRDGDMTPAQRLQGLADASDLAQSKDQKLLLISALGTVPQIESARRLAKYLDDPDVAETAGLTITMVAEKLPAQTAGEAVVILKSVLQKCPQPAVQERARASIAKLGGLS